MRKFLPILLVIVLVLLIGDSNAPAGSQLRAGLTEAQVQALIHAGGPDKIFIAQVSQSGLLGKPTATVLKNTLGVEVGFEYVAPGRYLVTCQGAIAGAIVPKVQGFSDLSSGQAVWEVSAHDDDSVNLRVIDAPGGDFADDLLNETLIVIGVFQP